MTLNELIAQFSISAATAKNENDIREALAALPGDGAIQIADFLPPYCRAKGFDPKADILQEFYRHTLEYKAAKEAQEKREALGRAFTDIEAIAKEYRENESRGAIPNQEQIDTITERIKKQTATLGAAQGKHRIYTAADYLDECRNYDPSKDFTPALFGGLAFPDGTTSYIGARTSRGKTTAMVNLARETLAAKQPRKTIFITLEMSGKQILNKLILSTAFSMGITADEANNPANRRAFMSMNASRDIYTVWKKGDLPGSGAKTFRHYVSEAYTAIHKAQTSGAFMLFDGRGADEKEIINFITAQGEKGAVILLDYIQKMPPKSGTDTDSFRRVQAISYDVVNAAAETGAVIIAGAQFNRLGGSDGLGDMFDDQSFREAGDIEQDAHNAIGIGWKKDKQGRFYEVLKTREDKKQGTIYDLDFAGEYSYMNQAGQIFRPQGKPGTKDKTNSNKKTTVYNRNGSQTEVEFNGEEPL
jgi:hypothetical protein